MLDHGHVAYAKTNIAHYRNTTWHKEVWSGDRPDIHVAYDVNYRFCQISGQLAESATSG